MAHAPRRHKMDEQWRNDPTHRGWDERRGTPKDANVAEQVGRAHNRYSASQQSEEKSGGKPTRRR